MKNLVAIVLLTIVTTVDGAEQRYLREYTYKASDLDSRVTARNNALKLIKTGVLEEIVTFVSSNSEIGQKQIGDDFRSSFVHKASSKSAGYLRARILDESWNGYELWLKAEVSADPDKIRDELEQSLSIMERQPAPSTSLQPVPAPTPVPHTTSTPAQTLPPQLAMSVNPVAQDNSRYIMMAKFGQAYALISPIRMMTMQQYSMTGQWPTTIEQIGMSKDDTSDGQYIDDLRLGNEGEIVALLSKEFGDRRVLKISPESVMGGLNVRWQCVTNLPVTQINTLSNFNCKQDDQLQF